MRRLEICVALVLLLDIANPSRAFCEAQNKARATTPEAAARQFVTALQKQDRKAYDAAVVSSSLADNLFKFALAGEQFAKKMIAAWGLATAILANAGVVKGKRVTGLEAVRELVERAGGKFTGRQLEVSKKLVTASDSSVGMRFGRALAEIVRI